MKISAVKNEFGDPIGLSVGEVIRPGLPDESVMLTGNYCYLEVLDADKHTADLYSAYSTVVSQSDFTKRCFQRNVRTVMFPVEFNSLNSRVDLVPCIA